MSGLYFRRWTRMYMQPAIKYFHENGVLESGYQKYLHLLNVQNPQGENHEFIHRQRRRKNKDKDLDTKLIEKLFKKYPDLKYESISRQKYQSGNQVNSYSYAYSFINEQKKLIKSGYKIEKAFEIVEEKFHSKMQRKMDQTLLSRGLAIGNKAQSFLNLYQQQVQFESKLKMLRTKRQVYKYEKKLQEMRQAVEEDVQIKDEEFFAGLDAESQNDIETGAQNQNQDQFKGQYYERIFQKVTSSVKEENTFQDRLGQINKIESDFENMFNQFYERAASKDKLRGLTDEEIKRQISSSPKKIKVQSRELIKYLKEKGEVSFSDKGDIRLSNSMNKNLRQFILNSPLIKIALINEQINYESPHYSSNRETISQSFQRLKALRQVMPPSLKNDEKSEIREKKLRMYESVIDKQIPNNRRIYKLFELPEERLLRLEIKYYENKIKEGKQLQAQGEVKLSKLINDFRRLKYRMERRYKNQAYEDLIFPQHFQIKEFLDIEDDLEYEELLDYLKKKREDRRLKAIDEVDDDKIADLIKVKARPQFPLDQDPISDLKE